MAVILGEREESTTQLSVKPEMWLSEVLESDQTREINTLIQNYLHMPQNAVKLKYFKSWINFELAPIQQTAVKLKYFESWINFDLAQIHRRHWMQLDKSLSSNFIKSQQNGVFAQYGNRDRFIRLTLIFEKNSVKTVKCPLERYRH